MPMNQHRGGTSSTGKNPFQTSWLRGGAVSSQEQQEAAQGEGKLGGEGERACEAGRRGIGLQGSCLPAMPQRQQPILWARERSQEISGGRAALVCFWRPRMGRGCDSSAGVMMEAGLSCSGWRDGAAPVRTQ